MAGLVKKKAPIVRRRRIDDEEGEEEEHELEDSLSEGSITDDDDIDNTSHNGALHSKTQSLTPSKPLTNGHTARSSVATTQNTNGAEDGSAPSKTTGNIDTAIMLGTVEIAGQQNVEAVEDYDDVQNSSRAPASQPVIVMSSAVMDQPLPNLVERRRREHEDYKKKRDEDPAFVPNRGAFFMHDHRHAGPAANGFRPFGRGRGRGGRGGVGGPFAPNNYLHQMTEPADSPWTHDMHEAVLDDVRPPRPQPQQFYNNGSGSRQPLPQAPRGPPPNRALSTTKHIGNVQLRIFLPGMEKPTSTPAIAILQYTRLPDHRPPLRRDKPVRISLPDTAPRYIFPAAERSFIFIPRAMRPNQQGFGSRSNRGRQGLGSIGGYSRRTSVYGGSVYGSAYSPSVAVSRRSSLAHEVPRESIIAPMSATMLRPTATVDVARPVVRLPPVAQPQSLTPNVDAQQPLEYATGQPAVQEPYTAPQKPALRENRSGHIPMQHPRPQKAVSVDNIESPAAAHSNHPQQHEQAFYHQVPAQVNGHGYGMDTHLNLHSRNTSYHGSTGTPLSQIPERAIHAQPFQPAVYAQQGFYPQQYPLVSQQQAYYYPQQYNSAMTAVVPKYVSAPSQQPLYGQTASSDSAMQESQQAGLVAQEVNGMVYYYDAAQLPAVAAFPAYAATAQTYPMQQLGAAAIPIGMIPPSPDAFYYPQPAQGVVYYPQ